MSVENLAEWDDEDDPVAHVIGTVLVEKYGITAVPPEDIGAIAHALREAGLVVAADRRRPAPPSDAEFFVPGKGPDETPSAQHDCPATIRHFLCTLGRGHPGPHEAGDLNHRLVARWQS